MSDFRIEHLQIADLKPNPRNARRHPKKQLHQIAASIREFGFNSIVVIDEDGVILVGHGRVEAAKLAGLTSLPVLRITHLTAEQKVGFSLADNKIALNADWDMEQLTLLWRELSAQELNFATRPLTSNCSMANRQGWSSRTLPTMYRSTGMSAASAGSSIGSSRWPRVR